MELNHDVARELFVTPGHITEEQLSAAADLAMQRRISLLEQMIRDGLMAEDDIGRTVAERFGYKYVALKKAQVPERCLAYIPEVVARAQRAVIFAESDEGLSLATENTDNYEFVTLLRKKMGKPIEIFYTTTSNMDVALRLYKGNLHDAITMLIAHCAREQVPGDIVRLVDLLLEYANDSRASDIHMEPSRECVTVRFRVDGILHEAARYPKPLHEKVVFRIKIMSRMQTDEHGTAQDGRFEHETEEGIFDVRVSILPISGGENIVMRLLNTRSERYVLESLGLRETDYQKVTRAIDKPHGMILAVGPTGSGKTTILYTILEKLNRPEINITTIEDPVEYNIVGIQQIQVNPKKELTFPKGLRSIVRQDPDVIMVGEIRDEETADIAVNAALTGHLLLSTLHTNDAATTFPRLTEMSVEPFLIASSVNLIVALRLVRIICGECKESYKITDDEVALIREYPDLVSYMEKASGRDDLASLRLYHGVGCKSCNLSGYSGRTGIFELLEMDEELRRLITQRASSDALNTYARKSGMTPLLYDGIEKVLRGVTTLREVFQAARA